MSKLTPSQYQETVISSAVEGFSIKIEAGAGCAKSSTIRLAAIQDKRKNYGILTFAKANAVESLEHPDRPSNAYYSTTHAIAYDWVVRGTDFVGKLKAGYMDCKHYPVCEAIFINLVSYKGLSSIQERKQRNLLRRITNNVITLFCNSAEMCISDFVEAYLQTLFGSSSPGYYIYPLNDFLGDVTEELIRLTPEEVFTLGKITVRYWDELTDSKSTLPITHDIYLKLFQIEGKSLNTFPVKGRGVDIDVLVLDECQDTNPCVESIFAKSQIRQKIIVGDRWQQLYAWRGAGDTMDHFIDFKYLPLPESFRFTPAIAKTANTLLSKVTDFRIAGMATPAPVKTQATLFRRNISILTKLIELASYAMDNPGITAPKVYVDMDLKELFSMMYHINSVAFNEKPKFPNYKLGSLISTLEELKDAAESNADIKALWKQTTKFATKAKGLYNGVEMIQRIVVKDKSEAQYVYSTIHKAKGLEYDSVNVSDDFISLNLSKFRNQEGDINEYSLRDAYYNCLMTHENICLLYVAITRAKYKLTLPKYIECFIEGVFYDVDFEDLQLPI